MAKCPNCEASLAWDAVECGGCKAMFSGASGWKPTGETREERDALGRRYPEAYPSPSPRDPSNPYAPPQAVVGDTTADLGRPGWVWAITIFFGLGIVWNVVFMILVVAGAIPLDDDGRRYWDNLNAFDHALSLLNSAVSLAGLVLLFLMRARATTFLMASLVISALSSVYHIAGMNFAAAAGTIGLVSMIVGFLIWAAVVWYAYRLRAAGRLR